MSIKYSETVASLKFISRPALHEAIGHRGRSGREFSRCELKQLHPTVPPREIDEMDVGQEQAELSQTVRH
jgi:hypothetical protein